MHNNITPYHAKFFAYELTRQLAAKDRDVGQTNWDMVIIDEAHEICGTFETMISRLELNII